MFKVETTGPRSLPLAQPLKAQPVDHGFTRGGYAYRARVHTSREVELVTAKCRSPVVEAMASSSGQVQARWAGERPQ